jgi:hypothetical protein
VLLQFQGRSFHPHGDVMIYREPEDMKNYPYKNSKLGN